MLSLQALLNPIDVENDNETPLTDSAPAKDNVQPQLANLSGHPTSHSHLGPPSALSHASLALLQQSNTGTTVQHNVKINRQTTLDTVYYHAKGTLVEYPETSATGRIGHVFKMNPLEWISPHLNFAYSLGGSHGMSQKNKNVNISILVDDTGQPVPCREMHMT